MFSSLFIGVFFKTWQNYLTLFDSNSLFWGEIEKYLRYKTLSELKSFSIIDWLQSREISRHSLKSCTTTKEVSSELHLWIFENINLSQFFDLYSRALLFFRNQINSSLWAYKAVQSALKLSNEQFKTGKIYVNNRMRYLIHCFWPQMPERKWDVGLSWIFYPQFGLAIICGYLLFPAGYLLVSGGYPLLTRRQLSWSGWNVARGD